MLFGKRNLWLILLIGLLTKTEAITCYTDSVCFDDSNYNECTATGGFYDTSDITCTERGFNVGACCAPEFDIYRQLSAGACSLYFATGATWTDTEEGEAIVCPDYKSCCIEGICHDEMEEADCVDAGGKFNEVGCISNPCVITGACCNTGAGFCADVPDGHCDLSKNTFLGEGSTCQSDCSAGYYEGNGRCCSLSGCSEVDSESECPATVQSGVFMDGLGCSADWTADCTGSCLVGDQCIRTFPHECIVLRGRFFAGGRCIPDPTDSCAFGNSCIDNIPISYCTALIDGVGTPDGTCDEYTSGPPGSCCYNGHCQYYTQNGELFCNGAANDGFHVNATCDTGVCFDPSIGQCCLLGMICHRLNETDCDLFSEIYIESGDILDHTWIPSNDTCQEGCGGTSIFTNRTIKLNFPVVVSKSVFSFVRTEFKFEQNFEGDEVDLSVESSSLNFIQNFTISASALKITSSEVVVGNCLKVNSGSSLSVDLENAQAGTDIQLLSYACREGDFDSIEINTNNDCIVSSDIKHTLFGLFYTLEDSCSQPSTSASIPSVSHTVPTSSLNSPTTDESIGTFEDEEMPNSTLSYLSPINLYIMYLLFF